MKTKEVNSNLIGKRCSFIFTAMNGTGTIVGINENRFTTEVEVEFDKPIDWGNDQYTRSCFWGRKVDEFGPLKYVELLEL